MGDSALDWGTGHQKSVQMNAAARNATLDQRTRFQCKAGFGEFEDEGQFAEWIACCNCIAEYELDIKDKICKIRIDTFEVKLYGMGFRPYP